MVQMFRSNWTWKVSVASVRHISTDYIWTSHHRCSWQNMFKLCWPRIERFLGSSSIWFQGIRWSDSSTIASLYRETRSPRNGSRGRTSRIALIIKSWGFMDRNDAINSCMNDIGVKKNKVGNYVKIFKMAADYDTTPLPQYRKYCTNKFHNLDCVSVNILTKIRHEKSRPVSNQTYLYQAELYEDQLIEFDVLLSEDPSFQVVSQPKILMIDYITYVLGACGTWFGFSFLILNPLPLVPMVMRKYSKEQNNHEKMKQIPITEHSNEILKLRSYIRILRKVNMMLIRRMNIVEKILEK